MRTSSTSFVSYVSFAAFVSMAGLGAFGAGCSGASAEDVSASTNAVSTTSIGSIARANVGKKACSENSEGGKAFDSSCTGNGGEPEYWCADFARWVWAKGGFDTAGLDAAAGSFYVYGQDHGTLHTRPAVGDAVVFDYHGGGSADHVAIVVAVNGNGTIETVSGDWGGDNGSEAEFASTSHVVLNSPAYPGVLGTAPRIMGMTISAFVAPAGTSGGSSSLSHGGGGGGVGCYSETLGKKMSNNACVQSSDGDWYQCDDGSWADRWTDPTPCSGTYPLGNGGHSSGGGKGCYSDTLSREMSDNACVQSRSNDEWYQCDDGSWTDRWTDPSACNGVYAL